MSVNNSVNSNLLLDRFSISILLRLCTRAHVGVGGGGGLFDLFISLHV